MQRTPACLFWAQFVLLCDAHTECDLQAAQCCFGRLAGSVNVVTAVQLAGGWKQGACIGAALVVSTREPRSRAKLLQGAVTYSVPGWPTL